MKKDESLIGIITRRKKFLIAAVLAVFLALCLTGCGEELDTINADDFSSACGAYGLIVTDSTSTLEDDEDMDYIETVILAASEDNTYQIEFYVMSTEGYAEAFFESIQESVESAYSASADSESSESGNNYQTYTVISLGTYVRVSQIGDTLLCAYGSSDQTDEIESIVIDELSY